MEHAEREAAPLIPLVGLCNTLVLADALPRIDPLRCVSTKNACIFYRTLTSGVTGTFSFIPPSRGGSDIHVMLADNGGFATH
jgi:hypothetical protein